MTPVHPPQIPLMFSTTYLNLDLTFYPVASRGRDLDLFQKMVEGDLTRLACSCHKRPITHNLTHAERLALKTFAADKSIVIRNVDKGGTVVVLDSEAYKEALRQLSDTHIPTTCIQPYILF